MIFVLLGADVLMAALFGWKFSTIPPQIPIFYSLPWGEAQLADAWFLLLLPALMHLCVGLNIWLYQKYFFPDSFMKKLIDVANWTLVSLATIIFARIIFLVA